MLIIYAKLNVVVVFFWRSIFGSYATGLGKAGISQLTERYFGFVE